MSEPVWITGIGLVSCLGEGAEPHLAALREPGARGRWWTRKASRPSRCIRCRRSTSTGRSRRRATSGRWSPGSGSAPTPRGSPSTAPARAAWWPTCTWSSRPAAASATRPSTRRWCRSSPPCRRREAAPLLNERLAERAAADPVPGAALQPAGRQHLHRPRRHRLLAHLHGRGGRRAPTRCASPRRGWPRAGAGSPWSAAPMSPGAGTCCCSTRSAGCCRRGAWAPMAHASGGGMVTGSAGAFLVLETRVPRRGARREGPRRARRRRHRLGAAHAARIRRAPPPQALVGSDAARCCGRATR